MGRGGGGGGGLPHEHFRTNHETHALGAHPYIDIVYCILYRQLFEQSRLLLIKDTKPWKLKQIVYSPSKVRRLSVCTLTEYCVQESLAIGRLCPNKVFNDS